MNKLDPLQAPTRVTAGCAETGQLAEGRRLVTPDQQGLELRLVN